TGLPFVFALWVGHAEANLADLRQDFVDSCRYGLDHVDEIAVEYASGCGLTPDELKVYLTRNIDYTLDEENVKGLRLFYKLARELGLVSCEKDLRLAEPLRQRAVLS